MSVRCTAVSRMDSRAGRPVQSITQLCTTQLGGPGREDGEDLVVRDDPPFLRD